MGFSNLPMGVMYGYLAGHGSSKSIFRPCWLAFSPTHGGHCKCLGPMSGLSLVTWRQQG